MSLKHISKVDFAHTLKTDDAIVYIATAFDWEPESVRLVQLAMKLDLMHWHGRQRESYKLEVTCMRTEPPESAVGVISRAGAVAFWKGRVPAIGRPGEYPREDLDWSAVLATNAAVFADEHGLDGSMDSLRRVDEILEESYSAAAETPEEGGLAPVDGDLAVLAGAYASEVMIAAFNGTWQPPDDNTGLPDFRIRVGRNGSSSVGMVGKVRKFLENGPSDAVHPAAMVLADNVIVT